MSKNNKLLAGYFNIPENIWYWEVIIISKYKDNQRIATIHQVEIIIDILIKNKLVTKEEFMEMMKERLDSTLMDERDKLEMLSEVLNRKSE